MAYLPLPVCLYLSSNCQAFDFDSFLLKLLPTKNFAPEGKKQLRNGLFLWVKFVLLLLLITHNNLNSSNLILISSCIINMLDHCTTYCIKMQCITAGLQLTAGHQTLAKQNILKSDQSLTVFRHNVWT